MERFVSIHNFSIYLLILDGLRHHVVETLSPEEEALLRPQVAFSEHQSIAKLGIVIICVEAIVQ